MLNDAELVAWRLAQKYVYIMNATIPIIIAEAIILFHGMRGKGSKSSVSVDMSITFLKYTVMKYSGVPYMTTYD